jgi:pantoate--beta-alanine ligase
VLTIVVKLLHLLQPEIAIFGRKDAQQCLVIDEMVRELDLPVRLIDAPTERDADGLALSSRNRYLSPEERRRAACIPRALARARASLAGGEREVEAVTAALRSGLEGVDAVEYAEVRSLPELTPLQRVEGRILLAVAARIGAARLIDNLSLEVGPGGVTAVGLFEDEVA